MLLRVPEILSSDVLTQCLALIENADWRNGRLTAGTQSEQTKNNCQLPESSPAARTARELILKALDESALFFSGALPKKIFPPLFNRYEGEANHFGNHIDNAVRFSAAGARVRTDLSATLFLSDPDDYDGGELVIEDTFGVQRVKLPAGDLVLYPSSSIHRVEPVTRGRRLASFFWVESMVRDEARRRLLFDMDLAIIGLREPQPPWVSGNDRSGPAHRQSDATGKPAGDHPALVQLTGCYHNLLRMWVES